ncbi:nuclear factor of activated T-cells, cytoplasmic 3 [Nelusetta ayraudi]|uniref:nuclear factor of activated T-cells, cytoplasmic 3 n=1 Tax=Nelusetta ayraudi TaxID=303726 RepID=UPI003F6E9DAF
MAASNFSEELDFGLVFEADGGRAAGPGVHVRGPPTSAQAAAEQRVFQELQSFPSTATGQYQQQYGYQIQGLQGLQVLQGLQPGAQENLRAFDCPSIQITSIAVGNHADQAGCGLEAALAVGGAEGGYPVPPPRSRGQLYLPPDACYRDAVLCPSPCSSLSSRSWLSDVSSCESFSHVYDDVEVELQDAARLALGSPLASPLGSPGCGGGAFGVELWQQQYQHPLAFSPALSPHQSPCQSPRTSVTEESWLHRRPASRPSSRPTSPCGKRRHSSADPYTRRSPSPHHSPSPTPGASPRGSVTEDTWLGSPAGTLGPLLLSELDVPSKTRRRSGGQLGLLAAQGDPALESFQDGGAAAEDSHDQDGLAELFLQVPSTFSWNKPQPGNPPLFRVSSPPPPLDWPLPSQFEQCELKLEVQPRSYHRAHYETEGSRGAIKAAPGGHPVVKLRGYCERALSLLLFIGTADERSLRPHAFYQVHRVTGKMVTTSCQEKIVGGTKVLEVPLLPENDMAASIDCAGILKLRNADIELKKGETDIGRKNTRVRVVFRVAVPQSDGRELWLQAASVPVECSQRSGQEFPLVESFSPAGCSADGGEELMIAGSNLSAQSRVVFSEKGPDGRSLWEVEARVLPDRSSASRVVVEVPPYHRNIEEPLQVQFYVSTGKRRRSLVQSFNFFPGVGRHRRHLVKQERWETDYIPHDAPGLRPASAQVSSGGPAAARFDPCDALLHAAPRLPQPVPGFRHPAGPRGHAFTTSSSVPYAAGTPSLTSRTALATPGEPLKDPVLGIKQEAEELQPVLGSLGLQEITLDDVNEIIHRDIGGAHLDQRHQYDWQDGHSSATPPFNGGSR